jgi:hypothetical protein
MIRSLAATPPNQGHPIAKKDDEDLFGWTDEVIEWDADHDDGYHAST